MDVDFVLFFGFIPSLNSRQGSKNVNQGQCGTLTSRPSKCAAYNICDLVWYMAIYVTCVCLTIIFSYFCWSKLVTTKSLWQTMTFNYHYCTVLWYYSQQLAKIYKSCLTCCLLFYNMLILSANIYGLSVCFTCIHHTHTYTHMPQRIWKKLLAQLRVML